VAVKACDIALPPEEDFEYGEDFKHKNKGGGQQQQQHGGGRKGMGQGPGELQHPAACAMGSCGSLPVGIATAHVCVQL
jgi:hypothetical protein